MNVYKLVSALIISTLFTIGCKDKTTQTIGIKQFESSKKEVSVAVKPQTASFIIDGMVCPDGCAKTLEKKLSEMRGVQNAKVDFEKKLATVNFDLDKLQTADLVKAVESTGDGKTYKVSNLKTNTKG